MRRGSQEKQQEQEEEEEEGEGEEEWWKERSRMDILSFPTFSYNLKFLFSCFFRTGTGRRQGVLCL